jgi:sporulation protein YlmC with PRC-barrel domain
MSEIENIRDWQGKDVLDLGGEKIGTVEDVYFDIETDEPRFLCVKAGWLRHRVVLIPAAGVTASPDHLTVAVTKGVAEKAPAMEHGGELSAEFEEKLFGYYELDYRPAQTPGGRRLVRR